MEQLVLPESPTMLHDNDVAAHVPPVTSPTVAVCVEPLALSMLKVRVKRCSATPGTTVLAVLVPDPVPVELMR